MKRLHVAVGVILDAQNRILLTRRAPDSHQGGLWEFPGGKVESGESLEVALARELHEELGIGITDTAPLLQISHDYPDKAVLLDVHLVRGFTGQPAGLENQPMAWVALEELSEFEFPAANQPIIDALRESLAKPALGSSQVY